MKSETRHYAKGSLIADSREQAYGLIVITSGLVRVELPMDSSEADAENNRPGGTTQLYVFGRGWAEFNNAISRLQCSGRTKFLNIVYFFFQSSILWEMICDKSNYVLYFAHWSSFTCRDSLGGSAVVEDRRWAGAYGVQADFVAMSHCSVEIIKTEHIMVQWLQWNYPKYWFCSPPFKLLLGCWSPIKLNINCISTCRKYWKNLSSFLSSAGFSGRRILMLGFWS